MDMESPGLKLMIMNRFRRTCILFYCLLMGGWSAPNEVFGIEEIWNMSLEELLDIPVVSAGKNGARYFDVPASLSVLQSDELVMRGFTNIPDSFRYTTGMQIASVSSSAWSVTIRGFPGRLANRIQVLKDGRSLYSPSFSGVFWETTDWQLSELDRIEIVKGSGGSTWGVNSVNGVINIISKTAFELIGGKSEMDWDTNGDQSGYLRYGKRFGDAAGAVYVKISDHEGRPGNLTEFGKGFDDWKSEKAGVRWDYEVNPDSQLRLIAEYTRCSMHERDLIKGTGNSFLSFEDTDTQIQSGNIDLKWETQLENGSFTVKSYAEAAELEWVVSSWNRYTVDFETFLKKQLWDRHQLVFGAEIRTNQIRLNESNPLVQLDQSHSNTNIYNAYVEDTIQLFEHRCSVVLGSRFEYLTDITGFVWEPNVRVSWMLSKDQRLWASFARASRTPSYGEQNLDYAFIGFSAIDLPSGPLPVEVGVQRGLRPIEPEILESSEIGYRQKFGSKTLLNLSVFRYRYHGVLSDDPQQAVFEFSGESELPKYVVPFGNYSDIRSEGIELEYSYNVTEQLRLDLGLTAFRSTEMLYLNSGVAMTGRYPDQTPSNQTSVSLIYLPNSEWSVFLGLRYVDSILIGQYEVDDYTEADASVTYKITDKWTLGMSVQNAFEENHPEFYSVDSPTLETREVRRGRMKLEYRF